MYILFRDTKCHSNYYLFSFSLLHHFQKIVIDHRCLLPTKLKKIHCKKSY